MNVCTKSELKDYNPLEISSDFNKNSDSKSTFRYGLIGFKF